MKDKVIVLTGASSGIGRATALALAREGAVLHLLARRADLLDRVCDDARALGGHATAHVVDVRDAHAFGQVAVRIHDEHDGVDVLINNAGVGAMKTFLETTDDDWQWTFDTNLHAVITGIRLFLPRMLERKSGMVMNIASLAALMANSLTAYSASKFAVLGLTESLVLEYGGRGVDFVVVCPGIINTEITTAGILAGRSSATLESKMLDLVAKFGASPDLVARDIVQAIRRPRFLVLSPTHASVLHAFHSKFPGLTRSVLRRLA
ncbi:MAG: SDR family NAD(P)-dependent oxidoreductase [Enhygromyxa sp.]